MGAEHDLHDLHDLDILAFFITSFRGVGYGVDNGVMGKWGKGKGGQDTHNRHTGMTRNRDGGWFGSMVVLFGEGISAQLSSAFGFR